MLPERRALAPFPKPEQRCHETLVTRSLQPSGESQKTWLRLSEAKPRWVFRGDSWFPVEDTVIEQSHVLLARAKAHATVFGPRNPRSRHSAFFRGQKRLNAKSCAELQTALSELLTAILGGRSSR
jgi:hypothetical protein